MFLFFTLLASKLVSRLACAPLWQLTNRVMIVTRTVKEACGVPTVAMCRYALDNGCNFVYMLLPTVEQERGCVYDVGKDKIIFATVVNANLRPCKSRTVLRLWSGGWTSEDIFSSAATKHSFFCFKWCEVANTI
ncbi:hypothetical protein PVAP13_6NG180303 [Panicum virgatum]|uniref:Secreted protein n=2 Tax=Panicum virgatum TaxID=38727 RepID=A0A8T0QXP7_PANVG|nr:hypothetical protein PVAP13_6NG180303 [Panicum virgatum]